MALQCETKMLGMKWRIWQEKILLMMRIKNHEMDTLCWQVYKEGRSHNWPGLWKEVSYICSTVGLSDVNTTLLTKTEIKEAISKHHMSEMVDIIKTKQKLDSIKDDDSSEVQDYFKDKSVENVRLGFCIRTEMVDKMPGNFKNKFRVKGTVSDGLICTECLQGLLHCGKDQGLALGEHCLSRLWVQLTLPFSQVIERLLVAFSTLRSTVSDWVSGAE